MLANSPYDQLLLGHVEVGKSLGVRLDDTGEGSFILAGEASD